MNFIAVFLLNLLIIFSFGQAPTQASSLDSIVSAYKTVQAGQTLDYILSELGFPARARGQIFSNANFPKNLILFPGAIYQWNRTAEHKEVVLFDPLRDHQWTLRLRDDQGELLKSSGQWTTMQKRIQGKIVGSLFGSIQKQVPSLKLAYRFQEVFLGTLQFQKLPSGTPFEMVYEELHVGSQQIGYGRMLYAKVEVNEELHERYLVRSNWGSFFVDPHNDQSTRMFYSPVGEVKISSTFQRRRFHPVKKRWIAHHGIDYELEPKSPVRAARSGTVTKVSYDRASGRHVIIRHGNGWESYYLHLQDFAADLEAGDKVRVGQLIGSVGCSGYCTKPHLHFALKQNGVFKDPAKLTKSFSAAQAVLAKNYSSMISQGRLAAWREGLDN